MGQLDATTAARSRTPSLADSKPNANGFGGQKPSLRLEVQCHAVDAITQMCGWRPVLEHMAEMAAAAAAVHFRAHHPEAAIGCGLDRARNRVIEARPAGAALELRLRHEQRLLAAR